MALLGLFALTVVTAYLTVALDCRSLGLFDIKRCNELQFTTACYNICGGRQTSIQTLRFCFIKPKLQSKIGDKISLAFSLSLDRPLNANVLYYDARVDLVGGRYALYSGEVCSKHRECDSATTLSYNFTQIIPSSLASYAGLAQFEVKLLDDRGLILCANSSFSLQK